MMSNSKVMGYVLAQYTFIYKLGPLIFKSYSMTSICNLLLRGGQLRSAPHVDTR